MLKHNNWGILLSGKAVYPKMDQDEKVIDHKRGFHRLHSPENNVDMEAYVYINIYIYIRSTRESDIMDHCNQDKSTLESLETKLWMSHSQ